MLHPPDDHLEIDFGIVKSIEVKPEREREGK